VSSERVDLLRRVPLFADLDERELQSIASGLKEVTFRPGQEVTTEGGAGIGFFIIQDGGAVVTVRGQERGRLGPGDYFGEIALIGRSDRTATVSADTELRCLGMTSWEFRPLVEGNGTVAWKLLEAMAKRIAQAEQRSF
jgi:CRP/FNR family transcriptional regulator, cyclic AMP receptor protein